jgi:hypothetical protein
MREEDLDWAHGQRTTMPSFLAHYTLHDAQALGCAFTVEGAAVLTFAWDRVWLEAPFTQAGLPTPEEPWLFLKFPRVLSATIDDTAPDRAYEDGTVARADSGLLSPEQRVDLGTVLSLLPATTAIGNSVTSDAALLEETHCTMVETIFERRILLYHTRDVVVLCQEADGRRIQIPGL